ncbi:MAG: UDP-N-acetylmuramate dehydrogenase [Parcubacteria group bacterium Athens0714_26]|nr:MAG: UDP-N-acetylmuramate dehydrogenase [Parcubacteria group bacterium Athens1014_26]TSD03675.1 MAG: UDP-N-acetylmuramate dehydrogenase [Parcubacteria group bacterium Athens0714_26]
MRILKNILLKKYTTFKIGCKTRYFIQADNKNKLLEAIQWAKDRGIKFFIIGGGSNVLFSDNGFDGLIIKNSWVEARKGKEAVFASSGAPMDFLVKFYTKNGFSGLEWAGGLPGTLGGAIRGDAGAFGGEIRESIISVESFNTNSNRVMMRSYKDCRFDYRDSIFKNNNDIILSAELKFKIGDKKVIKDIINSHIIYRKTYQPLEYPSAGSFFKNIPVRDVSAKIKNKFIAVIKSDPFPVIPAAAVIDALGLKGLIVGGAQVSEKHPNFIINKNNASCADAIKLMDLIKKSALKKFGIEIQEDVQIKC